MALDGQPYVLDEVNDEAEADGLVLLLLNGLRLGEAGLLEDVQDDRVVIGIHIGNNLSARDARARDAKGWSAVDKLDEWPLDELGRATRLENLVLVVLCQDVVERKRCNGDWRRVDTVHLRV